MFVDLFHIFSSESGWRLGTARVTIHFLLYAKERLVLVLWRESVVSNDGLAEFPFLANCLQVIQTNKQNKPNKHAPGANQQAGMCFTKPSMCFLCALTACTFDRVYLGGFRDLPFHERGCFLRPMFVHGPK